MIPVSVSSALYWRAPLDEQTQSKRRRSIMTRRLLSRFAIAIIAALFILTQPSSRLAQQPPPQQKQEAKQPEPQTPARDQETTVRISTQLVQIDATVTDKKGEHVEDLIEDDFELTVDGKK